MSHPVLTLYKWFQDLVEVREQLYASDTGAQLEGVARVKAWQVRGRLPHAVECTAHLVLAVVQDTGALPSSVGSTSVVQLGYTMALIRFVNGMLDPYQQATHAKPLSVLARQAGLPGWFVDLRHMGTHELLPLMELLREGVDGALQWLWDNYWLVLEESHDVKHSGGHEQEDAAAAEAWALGVKALLREFRLVRRDNPNVIPRQGDQSEVGTRLWLAMRGLREACLQNPSGLCQVLVTQNVLVLKKGKMKDVVALERVYGLLLEYLLNECVLEGEEDDGGEEDEGGEEGDDAGAEEGTFYLVLFQSMYRQLVACCAENNDTEARKVMLWLEWLVSAHQVLSVVAAAIKNRRTEAVQRTGLRVLVGESVGTIKQAVSVPVAMKTALLARVVEEGQKLGEAPGALLDARAYIVFLERLGEGGAASGRTVATDSPLQSDLEQLRKRMRLMNEAAVAASASPPSMVFEPVADWTPQPFGTTYG